METWEKGREMKKTQSKRNRIERAMSDKKMIMT